MTNPVAGGLPRDASADSFRAIREWIGRAWLLLHGVVAREPTFLVTLRENETTTTITDARIASTTAILMQPTTANAAGALATTYVSETGRAQGSAVITHANAVTTDRTFRVKLGGV